MLAGTRSVQATPAWCMVCGTGWHQTFRCTPSVPPGADHPNARLRRGAGAAQPHQHGHGGGAAPHPCRLNEGGSYAPPYGVIRRSSRDAARPCNTCMVRGGRYRVAPKVAVYQLVPLGTSATEMRAGAGIAGGRRPPATNGLQTLIAPQ